MKDNKHLIKDINDLRRKVRERTVEFNQKGGNKQLTLILKEEEADVEAKSTKTGEHSHFEEGGNSGTLDPTGSYHMQIEQNLLANKNYIEELRRNLGAINEDIVAYQN